MDKVTRRGFLAVSATGIAGALVTPALGGVLMSKDQQTAQQPTQQSVQPPKPPPLPAETVKQFVIAAHHDLDKVKEMLAAEPKLLNATWDWSHGDFEAAIGGAGHMGRRDIAQFLLDNGARMDIFVAAMMGHLDVVKSTLTAHPTLLHSKGPHGIPLLAHAKAGGDEAKSVLEYLTALG
jgi:hypothetical protein